MVAKKRRYDDLFENDKPVLKKEMEDLLKTTEHKQVNSESNIVKGKVIALNQDTVTLDVGSKSEAFIPISEFIDDDGKLNVKVSEEIDLFVMSNSNGKNFFSRKKLIEIETRKEFQEALEKNSVVEVKVEFHVKGGLKIVKNEVKGFIPGSLIEVKGTVDSLEKYVNKILKVKIIDYVSSSDTFIASRKAFLEEDLNKKRELIYPKLIEGVKFQGKVVNILDYGVFVDIGGLDGFIHISDLSWKRLNNPSELVSIGDEIEVVLLKFNEGNKKIHLGVKQLIEDPWLSNIKKLNVGDRVKGTVTNLTDFGAFLEIFAGVEGMIHVSEMSWVEKIKSPSQVLNVGDNVEAVVLSINEDTRRLSLGLKQVLPNPLEEFLNEKQIGARLKGIIKSVTDFGIFVDIGQSVDGLVKLNDLSWDSKDKSLLKSYNKNDEIDVVLLDVNIATQKISLGLKQLSEDPWLSFTSRFFSGSIINGKIVKIVDFGIFVEIEPGIDGLVHVKELSIDKNKKITDKYKEGEEIKALITGIDVKTRKISLSVKSLYKKEEQENISNYAQSNGKASTSLGDLLRNKFN